jgi:hypothetical protein
LKTKDAYTELAIQLAQLTAKVDKLLELAMKSAQEVTVEPLQIKSFKDISPDTWEAAKGLFADLVKSGEEFK